MSISQKKYLKFISYKDEKKIKKLYEIASKAQTTEELKNNLEYIFDGQNEQTQSFCIYTLLHNFLRDKEIFITLNYFVAHESKKQYYGNIKCNMSYCQPYDVTISLDQHKKNILSKSKQQLEKLSEKIITIIRKVLIETEKINDANFHIEIQKFTFNKCNLRVLIVREYIMCKKNINLAMLDLIRTSGHEINMHQGGTISFIDSSLTLSSVVSKLIIKTFILVLNNDDATHTYLVLLAECIENSNIEYRLRLHLFQCLVYSLRFLMLERRQYCLEIIINSLSNSGFIRHAIQISNLINLDYHFWNNNILLAKQSDLLTPSDKIDIIVEYIKYNDTASSKNLFDFLGENADALKMYVYGLLKHYTFYDYLELINIDGEYKIALIDNIKKSKHINKYKNSICLNFLLNQCTTVNYAFIIEKIKCIDRNDFDNVIRTLQTSEKDLVSKFINFDRITGIRIDSFL